jgi:hypothetical protein
MACIAAFKRGCYAESMDQQSSERARRAAAARRLVTRRCSMCGQTTVGTTKRRYCSARCRDRAYRGRQRALRLAPTPENAAALLEGLALAHPDVVSSFFGRLMAERPRPVYHGTCLQCGAPFEGSTRQKYCSRRCTNAAASVARKARGGLTTGQALHQWLVDRVDRWGPVPKRQQARWRRFAEDPGWSASGNSAAQRAKRREKQPGYRESAGRAAAEPVLRGAMLPLPPTPNE